MTSKVTVTSQDAKPRLTFAELFNGDWFRYRYVSDGTIYIKINNQGFVPQTSLSYTVTADTAVVRQNATISTEEA